MTSDAELRYLRVRLVAALVLFAAATLISYTVNHLQFAQVQEREDVAEALDLAVNTMAKKLLHFSAIRDAIFPYLAADDLSELQSSIPRLEAAIVTLKMSLNSGKVAPQTQVIFEGAYPNPLALLDAVVVASRIVANDDSQLTATGSRWESPASSNLANASSAAIRALPLIRQIKEIEAADLDTVVARMELWQQSSIGFVLSMLGLVWIGIFRPLERRLIQDQEALREERRVAEAASTARSTFIATMSHEIRTPLVGILGAAELLCDAPNASERHELSSTILGSGRALLTTLDGILNFSKIENGSIEIVEKPTSVSEMAHDLHRLFMAQASAKGIELRLDLAKDIAPSHMIDGMRLRQILANLVGNAVKFTETGTVTLGVHAVSTAPGRQALTFEITDTGCGLKPDDLGHVFEAFRQADGSTERRYGGTGLGLTIARRLAEAMGGSLDVQSTPGKGSVFRMVIDLPVVDPAESPEGLGDVRTNEGATVDRECPPISAAVAAAEIIVDKGPERTPLVIVVDDNETNRLVATRMIAGTGWHVVAACDGNEAIAAVDQLRPDLVLMDVSMPGMDGYAATRAIREMERCFGRPSIRIVAMSAHAGDEHRDNSLAAGMDDILPKPFSRTDITGVLAARQPG